MAPFVGLVRWLKENKGIYPRRTRATSAIGRAQDKAAQALLRLKKTVQRGSVPAGLEDRVNEIKQVRDK
jgi:hypothetical protein